MRGLFWCWHTQRRKTIANSSTPSIFVLIMFNVPFPPVFSSRQNIKVMTYYLCVLFAYTFVCTQLQNAKILGQLKIVFCHIYGDENCHLLNRDFHPFYLKMESRLMLSSCPSYDSDRRHNLYGLQCRHCHVNQVTNAVAKDATTRRENLSDIIETIWSNICCPISMKDICRLADPP